MMQEIRINMNTLSKEDKNQMIFDEQNLFRLNTSMPYTKNYNENLNKLFSDVGENFYLKTPLQGVHFDKVKIGKNVAIMSNCLMMSSGGITIDDDVMIAANVQLISNNHDLDTRSVITCLPIHIKQNCWIGAGATILRGVTIGKNSVVGAGSVVTKDVPDNVIVVGNPAKIIKRI